MSMLVLLVVVIAIASSFVLLLVEDHNELFIFIWVQVVADDANFSLAAVFTAKVDVVVVVNSSINYPS